MKIILNYSHIYFLQMGIILLKRHKRALPQTGSLLKNSLRAILKKRRDDQRPGDAGRYLFCKKSENKPYQFARPEDSIP